MTKRTLLRRRTVIGAAVLALAAFPPRIACAQSLPAFDIRAFVERLGERPFLDQIYADVFFLYSWRIQVRPMGYEGDPSWQQPALAFLNSVFNQVVASPGAMVAAATDRFEERYREALADYERNQEAFNRFLMEIGMDPPSQVATRIRESLQGYLALATAAPNADVSAAAESSYFWPFC